MLLAQRPRIRGIGPGRRLPLAVFVKRFFEATGNRPIPKSQLFHALWTMAKSGKVPDGLPPSLAPLAKTIHHITHGARRKTPPGKVPKYPSFYLLLWVMEKLGLLQSAGRVKREPRKGKGSLPHITELALVQLSPEGLAASEEAFRSVFVRYREALAQGLLAPKVKPEVKPRRPRKKPEVKPPTPKPKPTPLEDVRASLQKLLKAVAEGDEETVEDVMDALTEAQKQVPETVARELLGIARMLANEVIPEMVATGKTEFPTLERRVRRALEALETAQGKAQ